MKIFTLLFLSALAGSTAFAATVQPASFKKAHAITVPKAYDDYEDDYDSEEPVFDQPEGEYTMMTRDSQSWVTEFYNATHSKVLGSTVEMVVADDGTVWLNHMVAEFPVGTWIPAKRNGNTLTIDGPQLLYMEWNDEIDDIISLYVLPMKKLIDQETQTGTYVATDDLIYTFNIAEDGTLTSADPELLLGLAVKNPDTQEWVWKGFGDYDITISPQTDKPLELPEGLATETWVWSDPYDKGFVNVAFDGNDIYVSGMDREVPEAWVKGTIADGKAVFPSGQYMGVDFDYFYHNYFCGAKIEQIWDADEEAYVYVGTMTEQATFTYDAENKSLTLEGGYMTNSTADRQFPMMPYTEVVVKYQQRDPNAAPSVPYELVYSFSADYGNGWLWFQVPNYDVDDNLLDTSKLYYEILFDDEPLEFTLYDENDEEYQSTMIPYAYQDWSDIWVAGTDHTVYIYSEPQKSVKIRSVYINENNEQLKSDACVYELSSTINASLDRNVVNSELFDLQGRRINRPAKGIAIRVTTYSDGTVTRTKVAL